VEIVLTSFEGHDFEYRVRFEFLTTKNVSKYKAFIMRLGLVKALNAYPLHIHNDSKLVVGQCQRLYEARKHTMIKYL
jgi:ribonuclease HI